MMKYPILTTVANTHNLAKHGMVILISNNPFHIWLQDKKTKINRGKKVSSNPRGRKWRKRQKRKS